MTAARRQTQTRSVSAADARAYLDKAREFLRAAEDSLGLGKRVAASGNAVHAGIAAADAITAARAAVVWKGEHSQASAQLLPLKNRAEYDPDPIPAPVAKAAVAAAGRMVRIAEEAVR
jgi:hypothetical protein